MVKASGVMHADETGWRINGQTCWLRAFSTQHTTNDVIDRSRASPVVRWFSQNALVAEWKIPASNASGLSRRRGSVEPGCNALALPDFYGAYNALVCAGKQKCLVHLLRDLKKVAKSGDKSGDWPTFAKRLKRMLRDAIRLSGKRQTLEKVKYERLCAGIENRMTQLIETTWKNAEAKRLVKQGVFRKRSVAA